MTEVCDADKPRESAVAMVVSEMGFVTVWKGCVVAVGAK